MQLTGIEIVVLGKKRFVGKVGLCPKNGVMPHLSGMPVFYRDFFYKDIYSHKIKAISVDAAAWEKAEELGAKAMLCYCRDQSRFFYVPAEKITESGIVDLGEFPQYRIPLNKVEIYESASGLNFGWTNYTICV